jgi:hypothetical protein
MPVKFARVSFPYKYLNISRRFSGILFLNIFHFGYQHHLLTYSDCKYSGAIGLVLVLYLCFVDRCLSFFFWPLCCLVFFDIRILITSPFVIFKLFLKVVSSVK